MEQEQERSYRYGCILSEDVDNDVVDDNSIPSEYTTLLKEHRTRCDDILENIDQAITLLDGLAQQHQQVAQTTNALHVACEDLLREQNRLLSVHRALQERLDRFG